MTNGAENSSSEFGGPGGKAQLKAIIDRKQSDDDWLIIFLGADQDAWGAGSQVGTQHADTMSMTAGNAMAAATRASSCYFSADGDKVGKLPATRPARGLLRWLHRHMANCPLTTTISRPRTGRTPRPRSRRARRSVRQPPRPTSNPGAKSFIAVAPP